MTFDQSLTAVGLGDPYAPHPFLRKTLGYKRVWPYYFAMIIDPVLRFNWVLYAIFADDLQHSALLSFAVALSEVCRRGLWTLFRVEVRISCLSIVSHQSADDRYRMNIAPSMCSSSLMLPSHLPG